MRYHLAIKIFLSVISTMVVFFNYLGEESSEAVFYQALQVDEQRIIQAEQENWLTHGRTYSEARFSPLADINRNNVTQLGLAWSYKTGTRRGLEASPLVINGVMYTTGSWSRVYALNAETGAELWTFDPKVPGAVGRKACCDVVNRGLALWKGKLYLGTLDGRLIALDARDGSVIWEVVTVDQSLSYTITGAPRIVKDKVIIGNGGAEFGVRGYFSAYNAQTGKLEWRFYTVPANPENPVEHPELLEALKTWSADSLWETGLGGTVWDSFAYDPELNLLYVGTGNSSQYNRALRSPGGGDNLFLASILAVNPDTGRLKWHYQTTPAESWDYTATQHMILADLKIKGKKRKVIMQAPKNGFFYVLDRETGELISAEKYTHVSWASHVDLASGRPVETGTADWSEESAFVIPGVPGGHNWHPMSYSSKSGFVYIPTLEIVYPFVPKKDYKYVPNVMNTGEDWPQLAREAENLQLNFCSPTQLTAWDPVSQSKVWQVRFDTGSNGGVLSSAGGLVFQGNGTGFVSAYHDETGEVLWQAKASTGVIAPPVTYKVNGEQYIAVMAGVGGTFGMNFDKLDYVNEGHVLAFKLKGKAEMPKRLAKPVQKVQVAEKTIAAEDIKEGAGLYATYCLRCHGVNAKSGGLLPDLRLSTREVHEIWPAIVLGGLYQDRGMASFADVLTLEDVEKIHGYVITKALEKPGIMRRMLNVVTSNICIPPDWLAN